VYASNSSHRRPRAAHHITQRGNNQKQVFFADADYLLYLQLLKKYAARHELALWGYCLMPNHVHLIAVPRHPHSLSRALAYTHQDYARLSNIRADTTGHFWQSRYFSCPMDDSHTWAALAYVERNPIRAGLTKSAAAYRWSSAAAHLGKITPSIPLDLAPFHAVHNPASWKTALSALSRDEALELRVREANRTGRPLAASPFIQKLEVELVRHLTVQKVGRPPKVPTHHQTAYLQ
jgi:putative transposase